jgi:hypothetical protein
MPLDAQRLGEVRELLPHCTARILTGGGQAYGSGFFIDDGLLLTCGHVVKGKHSGDEVEVVPFMRPSRAGTVSEIIEGQEQFDLALIEVEVSDEEAPFPAVALDKAMGDHIDYYAAGFPKNPIGGEVGFEELVYRAHRSRVGEAANMLLFEAGQAAVSRGLSGGPVMNSETGAVVALVQYSNNPTGDSGGGAIPITRAATLFEPVRRALDRDRPPVATARWREALGREYWEGLGKRWEAGRWIDLVVGGDSRCWKVRMLAAGLEELSLDSRNLTDEVAAAVFRWSQGRVVRDEEGVELLGRLLAGAVLPDPLPARLLRSSGGDAVLLRLQIDGASELFDVPWEFAALKANGDLKYLAAEKQCGFVRVVPHPDEEQVETKPGPQTGRVVAAAIQPKAWQKFMPTIDETPWHKPGQVAADLAVAVGSAGTFKLDRVEPATPVELQNTLDAKAGVPTEVVHYVGFGRVRDGKPQLACADGDAVTWQNADNVLDWFAASGARVVVVQLLLPRWDAEHPRIRPRAFLRALRGRVNAVVFTRFPVHPKQAHEFNGKFYETLGKGGSVEAAVQSGRNQVRGNVFFDDAAAFGSFALVTGPKPDTRLAPLPVNDPLRAGTQQELGLSGARQSTPRTGPSKEVFDRS